MGLGDLFKRKPKPPPVSRPDELITVHDERGRELQITRRDWVNNVLLPHIEKVWNAPDELYVHIVQALGDDMAPQVAIAAERLVEIEETERALTVAAIVRMQNGDLAGAERELQRSIAKHGRSGVVLTNLAKVLEARGEHEASRATLREGLGLDPNQDNGLLWWAALARERGGEAAYLQALQEIAALPGAWRAQLWIAREKLAKGDRAGALALYEPALAMAPDDGGMLMMVTGDLGKAGALEEVVRLAGPRYRPEAHGIEAGANIVQALKDLGRTKEARELLRRLQAMNWAPFATYLGEMESQIVAAEGFSPEAAPPNVVGVVLEGPVWTRGLYDPDWLLPDPGEGGPWIGLTAFADETAAGGDPHTRMADGRGGLTRLLPLYLAEVLRVRYRLRVSFTVFVAKGIGPAVFGKAASRQELEAAWAQSDAEPGHVAKPAARRVLIAGTLVAGGIRLQVWDPNGAEWPPPIGVRGAVSAPADLIRDTEQAVISALRGLGLSLQERPPAFYWAPPFGLLAPYAQALEQALHLMLVANELVPSDQLWNERGFFESCFGLVDGWTDPPESARLLATYVTLAGVAYGSRLVEPYKKDVLSWIEAARPGSVLRRLAPVVFKRLNEQERLDRWRKDAPPLADAAYAAWLERVSAN